LNVAELKAREHNELGEDDSELSHKSNDDLIGLLENLKLDVSESKSVSGLLEKLTIGDDSPKEVCSCIWFSTLSIVVNKV